MMPSRPQPQPDMVYLHWYGRPEPAAPGAGAISLWPLAGHRRGHADVYRRETRRAVRRPVRRATLRPPNISFLQICVAVCAAESQRSCLGGARGLHRVQVLRFLGRHQPDPDQVEWADEPVADPEPVRARDRVPQRHRPVVLQQDKRGRGVIRDVLQHIPLIPAEHVDPLLGGLFRARGRAGLHPFLTVDAEPDESADLAADLDRLCLGQVGQMLDLQVAIGILVHGEGVDHPHHAVLVQPLQLGDHLAVKVGVLEAQHDELHRSNSHIRSFPRSSRLCSPSIGRTRRGRITHKGLVAAQLPEVSGRGSKVTRMAVILPLSTCRQFTVGSGPVVAVCRSNQVRTSGPSMKVLRMTMSVTISDMRLSPAMHSSALVAWPSGPSKVTSSARIARRRATSAAVSAMAYLPSGGPAAASSCSLPGQVGLYRPARRGPRRSGSGSGMARPGPGATGGPPCCGSPPWPRTWDMTPWWRPVMAAAASVPPPWFSTWPSASASSASSCGSGHAAGGPRAFGQIER